MTEQQILPVQQSFAACLMPCLSRTLRSAKMRATWAMMIFVVANFMKRAARSVQTPVFA